MTLANLLNLGPRSAEMLARAGIVTQQQLEELGPVGAYWSALQTGTKPNLNLLWALAGALSDTRWNELSPHRKQQLLDELQLLSGDSEP